MSAKNMFLVYADHCAGHDELIKSNVKFVVESVQGVQTGDYFKVTKVSDGRKENELLLGKCRSKT